MDRSWNKIPVAAGDSNEHWGFSCALLNDDSFVIRKSMIRKIVYPFGYVPPAYVANSPHGREESFYPFQLGSLVIHA